MLVIRTQSGTLRSGTGISTARAGAPDTAPRKRSDSPGRPVPTTSRSVSVTLVRGSGPPGGLRVLTYCWPSRSVRTTFNPIVAPTARAWRSNAGMSTAVSAGEVASTRSVARMFVSSRSTASAVRTAAASASCWFRARSRAARRNISRAENARPGSTSTNTINCK